ncbi:EAL domain-containing protein [Oxalobacter sp. OttesenSCG-928-P03]|nr:EAL domain-containing protein [Oxalobacter sp. OttesenSCG-928-P03]
MLNDNADQLSNRPFIITSALVSLIWLIASWFIAHAYVAWQTNLSYTATEKKARVAIGELYEGLHRTMSLLHAVPGIVSRDENMQQSLYAFNTRADLNNLSRDERAQYLHKVPTLVHANKELADAVKDIGVISVLWLMRKDGLAIASSNAETPESFVGTHYGDREYFKRAMQGHPGQQYAMGRRTNIPGLFFSAPVRSGKEVLGVTAGKIDLSYLYAWISQTNGFLIDEYGVIIQAADPELELMVMPGSEVYKLSEKQRHARYLQTEFKTLELKPWDNDNGVGSPLHRLGESEMPYYVLSTELKDHNLKLMIAVESPAIGQKAAKRQILFMTLAAGGILFILLVAALTYHFKALQLARKARARQELIEHLASHDSLTGLYSRSLTDQLITQGISIASRSGTKFAIMFIDVDLFKDINDSFGHEIGDEVLRELANRIKLTVRKTDIVIRHGGDEFIVLLNDINDPEDAASIAVNLQSSIQQPFLIQNTSMVLSASIGIAIYPNDGETPSLLLRHADTALYNVKEKGRADYSFYQTQMSVDLAARKTLEADMIRGLENREFFLVYQPQYSHIKGGITGCEALVRWRHPIRGIVPPIEFIPTAERSGFISQLGEWVLNEACRQTNEWRNALGAEIPVSVNLSTVQFQRSDLLDIVRRVVKQHKVAHGALELEVTESVLMSDTERTFGIMQEMKSLGIRISIDDFGTGYSSLAYLKKFDADVLKIDRTFVSDMENNTNDRAIISAVISMAQSLDYHVIAEGVETREQYDLLMEMGCYAIQGYWFSKPLPAEEFAKFYVENQNRMAEQFL